MPYFDSDNRDVGIAYTLNDLASQGLNTWQIADRLAKIETLERLEMAEDLRHPSVQQALCCTPVDEHRTMIEQAEDYDLNTTTGAGQ